jgi:hypothetical protein
MKRQNPACACFDEPVALLNNGDNGLGLSVSPMASSERSVSRWALR